MLNSPMYYIHTAMDREMPEMAEVSLLPLDLDCISNMMVTYSIPHVVCLYHGALALKGTSRTLDLKAFLSLQVTYSLPNVFKRWNHSRMEGGVAPLFILHYIACRSQSASYRHHVSLG